MSKDKNITPRNNKGQTHGLWKIYWGDILWYKSFFQNGKRVGYSELYSYDGNIAKKTYNL